MRLLLSIVLALAPAVDAQFIIIAKKKAGGPTTITYQSTGSGAVTDTSGSTCVITGLAFTAGWLVVASATYGDNRTVSSIVDGSGNTWSNVATIDEANASGRWDTRQWYSVITTGGSNISITFTTSASSYTNCTAVAYSSSTGWPAAALDKQGTNTGSSATASITASSGNVAAVQVGVAILGTNGGPTSPGWTRRHYIDGNSVSILDRITTGIETMATGNMTVTNAYWGGILGTFKPN